MTRLIPCLVLCVFAGLNSRAMADDWNQWLGNQRDGVWREKGIVESFPKGGPKKVWEAPVGAGYTGPAVSHGKLFLMDRHLSKGAHNPESAFSTAHVDGNERLLCFDSQTGKLLWNYEYHSTYRISYASGPRCTPIVDENRVYFLGAMGNLHCCNTADGKVIWKQNLAKSFDSTIPVWGFAAHPLVDGNQIICVAGGHDNHAVVALDKMTGKQRWHALSCPGDVGYCPPMIFEFGGRRQLIIWHAKAVNGLEPETGKLIWTVPFECRASLNVATPRKVEGDRLFLTSFYTGSMLLKVTADSASVVWKGLGKGERPQQTTDLNSIMATAAIDGPYAYSVCSYGELRGIDVLTGKRLWATNKATRGSLTPANVANRDEPSEKQPWMERWAHAFITPHEGHYFLFNEQGELIIAKMSPKGYAEVDRAKLIEPTNKMAGRPVVWTHPAYADKKIFVRNDEKLVCYDLAK
ncbi:MAG: PQQ-binding-like beta-propeller repeat protein [Gemmataceae bacterium]